MANGNPSNQERLEVSPSGVRLGSWKEIAAYLTAADRALISEGNPVVLAQIAAAFALAGKESKAREVLGGVEAQEQKRYICGFNIAGAYSVLGDKEQAFAWLNRAFLTRSD